VRFDQELADVLPEDVPNRLDVIRRTARHLELIVEANRHFNLTRITNPRDAAIKHVLDSLMPWKLFDGAIRVIDAGTGAGFPGIPLALVLPSIRFTLAESVGKKARFVEAAVMELGISNVEVVTTRVEELFRSQRADVITARAVAPMVRAVALLAPALKRGARALLYKGPDVEAEIDEAQAELLKARLKATVVSRYELPESSGSRSIALLTANT
jgi:16S rRNA (guanine527-N7)-methyltransferase